MTLNRTELLKHFDETFTVRVCLKAEKCKHIPRQDKMIIDTRGAIRCVPCFELEDFISGMEKHIKEVRVDFKACNRKMLNKVKRLRR